MIKFMVFQFDGTSVHKNKNQNSYLSGETLDLDSLLCGGKVC